MNNNFETSKYPCRTCILFDHCGDPMKTSPCCRHASNEDELRMIRQREYQDGKMLSERIE